MPEVSIILPAFRPKYLDASIASALAQTFRDFELLIGDDSDGDDVASVVSKWSDRRIKYARNPRRGQAGSNRDELLANASGEYVKFLFDDDLLLPQSIEVLVQTARATQAKLTFHSNHTIDEIGRVVPHAMSTLAVTEGAVAEVTKEAFFQALIYPALNLIGGPVNILVENEALRSLPMPFGIEGSRMRFLGDMALYVNMLEQGHGIAGIGARLSGFRLHGGQMSNENSPIHSAGVFEWELLARWTADRWSVAYDVAVATLTARHQWYRHYLTRYPQLEYFIALGTGPDDSGHFLTDEYNATLAKCRAIVDAAGRQTPE